MLLQSQWLPSFESLLMGLGQRKLGLPDLTESIHIKSCKAHEPG